MIGSVQNNNNNDKHNQYFKTRFDHDPINKADRLNPLNRISQKPTLNCLNRCFNQRTNEPVRF